MYLRKSAKRCLASLLLLVVAFYSFGDSLSIGNLLDLAEEQQAVIDESIILIDELTNESKILQALLDEQIQQSREQNELNSELQNHVTSLTGINENLKTVNGICIGISIGSVLFGIGAVAYNLLTD